MVQPTRKVWRNGISYPDVETAGITAAEARERYLDATSEERLQKKRIEENVLELRRRIFSAIDKYAAYGPCIPISAAAGTPYWGSSHPEAREQVLAELSQDPWNFKIHRDSDDVYDISIAWGEQ
jgi:hypothetical protein